MIFSPKNIAKNVPETKNGPKGIWDFIVFRFKKINIKPTIAPLKKAKNKATKIFGQPKKRPIKIESLKSPQPIQVSFEIKMIARKNREGKIPMTKFQIPNKFQ